MKSFAEFIMEQHPELEKEKAEWFERYFINNEVQDAICHNQFGNLSKKEQIKKWQDCCKYFMKGGAGNYIKEIYDKYWNNWKNQVGSYTEYQNGMAVVRKTGYDADKKDFKSFIIATNLRCCYCGANHDLSALHFFSVQKQLKPNKKIRNRGQALEVEHIVNSKYRLKEDFNDDKQQFLENLTLACYICNNAKSDFCSAAEFKPIAEGIAVFWKKAFENLPKENQKSINRNPNISNINEKIWDYRER